MRDAASKNKALGRDGSVVRVLIVLAGDLSLVPSTQ